MGRCEMRYSIIPLDSKVVLTYCSIPIYVSNMVPDLELSLLIITVSAIQVSADVIFLLVNINILTDICWLYTYSKTKVTCEEHVEEKRLMPEGEKGLNKTNPQIISKSIRFEEEREIIFKIFLSKNFLYIRQLITIETIRINWGL